MTVGELIEKLQSFNSSLPIRYLNSDYEQGITARPIEIVLSATVSGYDFSKKPYQWYKYPCIVLHEHELTEQAFTE